MSPVRLVFIATACTALGVPFAGHAAQTATASADCSAPMTLTERRINEHAGAGKRALISYVQFTQPIFQVTVDEAVAMVDAHRASGQACAVASAR